MASAVNSLLIALGLESPSWDFLFLVFNVIRGLACYFYLVSTARSSVCISSVNYQE